MRNLFVLIIVCMLSGCAYVENRARDAADMVTIAVEGTVVGATIGVAPSVQLSPFYYGLGYHDLGGGGFGLRSGAIDPYEFSQYAFLFFNVNNFLPSEFDSNRGKGYKDDSVEWFNYGQIEAAVGLGIGVRAGINFFEIADFIVGLAGLDICNDDIAGVSNDNAISKKR
ncbi:MAG: hypothetical protein JXA96_06645 [Sedimentisphaerales bacterium]|nr:hypothetical protein [Sedimentisphaerales bacterium]